MLLMRSAVVHIALLAVETISAESFHIRRYKGAFTESLDFTAKFIHNTHHLMPDSDARYSPWYAAVLDMQVTCADAAHGHRDDSISRLQNHRLWLFNQFKPTFIYILFTCTFVIIMKFHGFMHG